MKAFRECQFDYAYIARYSPRKQTYAARMPGHVPAEAKAQRWEQAQCPHVRNHSRA